jgi:hypothetical protein
MKAKQIISKKTIIVILLSTVVIIGFNMNRAFLVIANSSHNLCNSEAFHMFMPEAFCGFEDLYKKVAESGIDVQDSSICNSGNRMDTWDCVRFIEIAEDKRLKKLSYPKVTDHIWNVNRINISPKCMEEIWISADNYEEYEGRYPQAKNFRNYPGQYWGNLIPIEPINPGWESFGHPFLSLPKPLSSCNKIGPEDSTSINGNLFSLTFPIDSIHSPEEKKYTLIAEWGSKECSKLVPHFTNNCQSLVFVKLDVSFRYPDIQSNTYAHITDNGEAYIVPVTTVMPLEDVISLIESK